MRMTPNYSYFFPAFFPPQFLWSTKYLNGYHPTSFIPTKTEFIIIGLPGQIKNIPDPSIHLSNNSSSTTFTSDVPVRNPGVIFDPHLSFFQYPTSPAPASCTSVTSAASDPCLTLKPPPPSPPPSSIIN